MTHRFSILIATLCFCSMATAQSNIDDKELTYLIDVVEMLRVSSKTNFDKATRILAGDTKWTPMNETGVVREGIECKASEKVAGFKLNRILTKVDGERKFVTTHGDMVNGEDCRYDYSLYERALKAKAQVNYTLKGREGKQTFVIIPYNSSAKFEAYIECDGNRIAHKQGRDGTIIVTWDDGVPTKEQEFVLSIKNNTNSSQSFVIINHNTRKK